MTAAMSSCGLCANGRLAPSACMRAEGAAEHQQVIRVVEFRGIAAAAGKQGEQHPGVAVQAVACRVAQRRDHGYLGVPPARWKSRAPPRSGQRSSARVGRTWRSAVRCPRSRPGRRGSRSCSGPAGGRRSASRRTLPRRSPHPASARRRGVLLHGRLPLCSRGLRVIEEGRALDLREQRIAGLQFQFPARALRDASQERLLAQRKTQQAVTR
jgi:hypothetical protein